MDKDTALRNALAPGLARLRAELAERQTPPGVEKELMQAFARMHAPRPWWQRLGASQWRMAGGAGSALALCLVMLVALRMPTPDLAPATAGLSHEGGMFIALDSLERIEQEPAAQTVQAELTGADLAAMGVPVSPETAGDTVRAELLIGSEGQPLALRFL